MTRLELENKLNNDFAWMLETWSALSPEDRTRNLKASAADPEFFWNAQDHLVHLAGIEAVFNNIVRRAVAGEPNPIQLFDSKPDGTRPSKEEVMLRVHQMNDDWIRKNRGKSFDEVVALSQKVRAETLALLAELSEEQLGQKIPGAPWADGTIGGVMGVNGDHARQHHGWITRDLAN